MSPLPRTAGDILEGVPFLCAVRRAAGGRRLYLVGGSLRDALLGRHVADFDFLVDDALTVAERLAGDLGGAFVPLHEEHQTARVVVSHADDRISLDFSVPKAGSLTADLRARDFTINALAAGPIGGRARILDPCGGRNDIARRTVRMTSRDALISDPVRVVRAYRFASILGFRIDARTRRACRELADLVGGVASERLGAELLSTLGGERYPRALSAMAEDGVLTALLPEFERAMGVDQGGVHELDVAEHSLLAAERLSDVMSRPDRFFPRHADLITEYLADEQTRSGLVLATLLHDIGKPERRTWGGNRWRFFGHEERGVELANEATVRLRLPRRVRRQVKSLVGSHMRILPFMQTDDPTPRARRRFMRNMARHSVGAILLALADRRSLRTSPVLDDDESMLRRLALLLAAASDGDPQIASADLPVTGDDLIALGLAPGPRFKEILEAVEEHWVAGALTTRDEALEWVKSRFVAGERD